MGLDERIDAIARSLREREARHADAMASARAKADQLHATATAAIARFSDAVGDALPGLRVDVSDPRLDDKHVHAIEFDLERGRHRAIVTVKSKSEVIFVGPFRVGKNEGPCKTLPFDPHGDLEDALGDLIERFLEEATNP